jgi:hypothetical protein
LVRPEEGAREEVSVRGFSISSSVRIARNNRLSIKNFLGDPTARRKLRLIGAFWRKKISGQVELGANPRG